MNRFLVLFTGIIFVLASALSGAVQANASTPYDNFFKEVQYPIKVGNKTNPSIFMGQNSKDIGLLLGTPSISMIQSQISGYCGRGQLSDATRVFEAIEHIRNGGSYTIWADYTNQTTPITNTYGQHSFNVLVDFSSSTTTKYTFNGYDSLRLQSDTSSLFYFNVAPRSNSSLMFCPQVSPPGVNNFWSLISRNAMIVENNILIEYPPGYDGYKPPITNNAQTLKFGWTLSNNKLNVIQYVRTPKLDYGSGSLSRWQYIVTKHIDDTYDEANSTVQDNKTLHLYEMYEYEDLPVGYYTIKINLITLIPGVTPTGIKTPTFKIQNVGQFVSGSTDISDCNDDGLCSAPPIYDLSSCFQDTFPFINISDCTADIKGLFYLMSFKTFTFGDNNIKGSATGCKTLDTFDNWLNLPNGYIVCPQIPQQVRSVVTPFITFILGLIIMKFVLNRQGRGL